MAENEALTDLRRHLRVVTFTLTIIMASFVIVASFSGRQVYRDAIREARIAAAIAEDWNANGAIRLTLEWIAEQPEIVGELSDQELVLEVDLSIPDSYAGNTSDDLMARRLGGMLSYKFFAKEGIYHELVIGDQRVAVPLVYENHVSYRLAKYNEPITTLSRFSSFWNELPDLDNFLMIDGIRGAPIQSYFDFKDQLRSIQLRDEFSLTQRAVTRESPFGGAIAVDLTDPAIRGHYRVEFLSGGSRPLSELTASRQLPILTGLDDENGRLATAMFSFAASYQERDPSLRRRFALKHGLPDHDFAGAFPALQQVFENISSLSFDQLESLVGMLEDLNEEEASLFGLAVPQSLIATWGVAVITLVYLYLLTHIRQYFRLTEGSDLEKSTWIGDYRDLIARLQSIIILVGIPFVSTSYLLIRSIDLLEWSKLLAISFIAYTTLVFCLYDMTRQLWWRWRTGRLLPT